MKCRLAAFGSFIFDISCQVPFSWQLLNDYLECFHSVSLEIFLGVGILTAFFVLVSAKSSTLYTNEDIVSCTSIMSFYFYVLITCLQLTYLHEWLYDFNDATD